MVLKLLCCCVFFPAQKKKLPMFFFGKDGGSHVEHPTCPWGSLACPPPQPPQVSSIVCVYRYAYVYYKYIYILEYILVGILRCQVFLIFSDGKAVGHPFGALWSHQAAMYSKGVFACWEGSTRPKEPSGPEMCQGQDLRCVKIDFRRSPKMM